MRGARKRPEMQRLTHSGIIALCRRSATKRHDAATDAREHAEDRLTRAPSHGHVARPVGARRAACLLRLPRLPESRVAVPLLQLVLLLKRARLQLARSAAVTVFATSIATVMWPTPPGTGLIAAA